LLLYWVSLLVFFAKSLHSNVNDVGSLWILTAFVYYPVGITMAVKFMAWKDDGWKITNLDKDGDGDVSCWEMIAYVNVTPIMLGLCIVFIWIMNIFTNRTIGLLLTLVFVLGILGFFFLRDWAKNDFYLSPRFQKLGNYIVQIGMWTSFMVGLIFDVSLLICLSMFFFLYLLRELTTVFARKFVMEPDVPIYISPYVFPIYSYTSRTNDLVDETVTGIRLYSAMIMFILWGVTFAIFVTPQALGVTIACVSVIGTVVLSAVLIEQVPLSLGSSSRFLDTTTIADAAQTAKSIFAQRRKPIEFECAEWEDADRNNPTFKGGAKLPEEQRKSAADVANDLSTKIKSLRRMRNRRGEEKFHSDALYTHSDAIAEAVLAGKGPLGVLGLGGMWYRCFQTLEDRFKTCCKFSLLKMYDAEGQRLNVEKLKRKFDSLTVLQALTELDVMVNQEFHEELRCVIHLWLLLIVAADARLRREKVLFQKFLRENRFKLLSNGIAPPKNIFSSASFASINISLVAVWLSTLTPEERERFHLLKSKFSEEQASRDAMVDKANQEAQAEADQLMAKRRAREEEMCKRRFLELQHRREIRLAKWQNTLLHEDQKRFMKNKAQWMKNTVAKVAAEEEALYQNFLENVTIQGGDEALVAARETILEIESAEKGCKPGMFGRAFQFYDPDFPQSLSSLGKDCGVEHEQLEWNVSLALNANAVLFDAGTDPDDVFKGKLNDGWLLSAISMLAAAGGVGDGGVDEQVQQLFVGFMGEDGKLAYHTSVGVYGVRLFKNGQWETVVVDDFFPALKAEKEDPVTRGVAFAFTKEFKELWVPLIEKAFAKYLGSYSELQFGYVHHALEDLTGCTAEEIHLSKASRGVGKRALWDLLVRSKKNGYILGAGSISSALADRQILDTGLVFGAAYTIYDVRQVDDYQLLKLRNPPGDHDEWKGDWGDASELWTKRYRKKLGFSGAVDDNTFWMSFDDFCIAFNSLYICRWYNPSTWKSKTIHGQWKVGDSEKNEVDTSSGLPSK
jgi:hypothetical protein